MSTPEPAAITPLSRVPRPQGPRRPRLASLKNSTPASLRARSESLQPLAVLRRKAKPICPECGSNDLSELDGTTVCSDCGVTVRDSNIVAEVTFGESATGAAIVQGGFVGEGQTHARTGQPRGYVHEVRESREISEANGREELRRQATWLNLSEHVLEQATRMYKLALGYNFIQGRLIKVVAAVCLYGACRRDPNNQTILMDFAEAISVNVFKLGQTWTDMQKSLYLEDLKHVPVIDVEKLIYKFAKKLEFGNSFERVAEDAARLLKRMKRDWIVTGRRPAGLVGACIILAARMNNFRRTVREVVYVVKVADPTLIKRLEEFNRTDSSRLTVDEFRKNGLRLKRSHDPPIYHDQEERAKKRQKKTHESPAAESDGAPANVETEQSTRRVTRSQRRLDADGFAIPEAPASSATKQSTQNKHSRGKKRTAEEAATTTETTEAGADNTEERPAKRGRKSKRPTPLILTEDDLMEESELETEMQGILNDPESIAVVEDAAGDEEAEARAKTLADSLRDPSITTTFPLPDDPEIGEHEFEDDPEVANCLLSEAERKIKETIWVTHNEDWLRSRQEKWLRKAAEEASGDTKKPKKPRKRGRMGDGSLLEGGAPIRNAADAARRMLEKHAVNPSKHINYQNVDRLYADLIGPESIDGTAADTRSGSLAPTEASQASEEQAVGTGAEATPVPSSQGRSKKPVTPAPVASGQITGGRAEERKASPGNDPDGYGSEADRSDFGVDPEELSSEDEMDEDEDGQLRHLGFDNDYDDYDDYD